MTGKKKLSDIQYKNRKDYNDLWFQRNVVSLDSEEFEELEYIPPTNPLSEDERKLQDRLWKDVRQVCGSIYNPDYIIMYQHVYLGESLRNIASRLNVSHMAVQKRFKKVIQKLKYLYGFSNEVKPYRRKEGNKL